MHPWQSRSLVGVGSTFKYRQLLIDANLHTKIVAKQSTKRMRGLTTICALALSPLRTEASSSRKTAVAGTTP
jgi:hypothetical protein